MPHEKQRQIGHRLTQDFVHRTLDDFNAGALDASEAASRLGMSRSHLFRLRHRHLDGKPVTAVSGSNQLPCYGPRPSKRL